MLLIRPSLKSSEDSRYLNEIILEVERRFDVVRKTMGLSDPLRIAIISSILIADDLKKLQKQSTEAESLTRNLIELIDRTID
jgi:cell division protein ZapA (FtsZ GTPase activity inhibitor)